MTSEIQLHILTSVDRVDQVHYVVRREYGRRERAFIVICLEHIPIMWRDAVPLDDRLDIADIGWQRGSQLPRGLEIFQTIGNRPRGALKRSLRLIHELADVRNSARHRNRSGVSSCRYPWCSGRSKINPADTADLVGYTIYKCVDEGTQRGSQHRCGGNFIVII